MKKKHSYMWHDCPICSKGYCIAPIMSPKKSKLLKQALKRARGNGEL